MNIFATLAAVATSLDPSPAPFTLLGYIDPGTGSLILQVAIGAVVGSLVAAKLYWLRLKAFFTGRAAARRGDAPENGTDL